MLDIYRMWRFIRLVRKHRFGKKIPPQELTDFEYISRFSKLKTIFRHEYGISRGMDALDMLEVNEYVWSDELPDDSRSIGLRRDGLKFSTHTALINNLAKSIVSVSSLTAVIIAGLALYVSI